MTSIGGLEVHGAEVTGDTYPVRAQLRAAGGRWDGQARAWVYSSPAAAADAARAAVQSPPVDGAWRPARRTYACRCSGEPGGRCCGRSDCRCFDCD